MAAAALPHRLRVQGSCNDATYKVRLTPALCLLSLLMARETSRRWNLSCRNQLQARLMSPCHEHLLPQAPSLVMGSPELAVEHIPDIGQPQSILPTTTSNTTIGNRVTLPLLIKLIPGKPWQWPITRISRACLPLIHSPLACLDFGICVASASRCLCQARNWRSSSSSRANSMTRAAASSSSCCGWRRWRRFWDRAGCTILLLRPTASPISTF